MKVPPRTGVPLLSISSGTPPLALEQGLDGLYDGVGVNFGGVHQFGGLAGTRHFGDGELDDGGGVVADADEASNTASPRPPSNQ